MASPGRGVGECMAVNGWHGVLMAACVDITVAIGDTDTSASSAVNASRPWYGQGGTVSRPTTSGQARANSDTGIAYASLAPPSPLATASIPSTTSPAAPPLTVTGDPLYPGCARIADPLLVSSWMTPPPTAPRSFSSDHAPFTCRAGHSDTRTLPL